jgi:hypothetical protein
VSPAAVKAALDALPNGKKAISLEGSTLYDVQDTDNRPVFRDPLADGSLSPWMDQWSSTIRHRFDTWFANFSAIGGTVDIVLSDFEGGGQLYWYDFARRGNGTATAALLAADPRWNATRQSLNAAARRLLGPNTPVTFDNIDDINTWVGFTAPPFLDWRPYIWDAVLVDNGVAGRWPLLSPFAPFAFA